MTSADRNRRVAPILPPLALNDKLRTVQASCNNLTMRVWLHEYPMGRDETNKQAAPAPRPRAAGVSTLGIEGPGLLYIVGA